MEQVYSLSEYNVQQRAQEEQSKSEWRYGLESARKDLAGGNLQKAISSYGRAKFKGAKVQTDQAEGRELKELEQDVRRAQSSNLIMAQNNYFLAERRAARGPAGAPAPGRRRSSPTRPPSSSRPCRRPSGGRNLYLNYDENVASLQWDKLEKAQQVAVAKVAPLHVNLPTRGVRYSFSQVLQTELRKPMTIRLLAENTKVPSWTTRIGLSVLGLRRALGDRGRAQPAEDGVSCLSHLRMKRSAPSDTAVESRVRFRVKVLLRAKYPPPRLPLFP